MPAFSFVGADGSVVLGCWGFSVEGVELQVDEILGFNDVPSARRALDSLCRARLGGAARLAVESTCPLDAFRTLVEAKGSDSWVQVDDGPITEARLLKSADEIARLTRSLEVAERTVAELFDLLEPGLSRLDLTREAKRRLLENGADGVGHVTFSFGYANPEIALEEPLSEGKLLTLDLGCIVDGYCSDNRRYAFGGAVPAALQERYELMVEIVDQVGAALLPGTSYADVHRLALDAFDERGVQPLERFSHTGHNIGLETEEQWIDDNPDAEIRPGMVINIELYSIAETGGQIGTEETYVIEDDGPRCISVLPREIREVS
jgi:Xaa-Pro aminopeptidase